MVLSSYLFQIPRLSPNLNTCWCHKLCKNNDGNIAGNNYWKNTWNNVSLAWACPWAELSR